MGRQNGSASELPYQKRVSSDGETMKMLMLDDRVPHRFPVIGIHIEPRDAVKWAREILTEAGFTVTQNTVPGTAEWWDWSTPLYLYMREADVKLGESDNVLSIDIDGVLAKWLEAQ